MSKLALWFLANQNDSIDNLVSAARVNGHTDEAIHDAIGEYMATKE